MKKILLLLAFFLFSFNLVSASDNKYRIKLSGDAFLGEKHKIIKKGTVGLWVNHKGKFVKVGSTEIEQDGHFLLNLKNKAIPYSSGFLKVGMNNSYGKLKLNWANDFDATYDKGGNNTTYVNMVKKIIFDYNGVGKLKFIGYAKKIAETKDDSFSVNKQKKTNKNLITVTGILKDKTLVGGTIKIINEKGNSLLNSKKIDEDLKYELSLNKSKFEIGQTYSILYLKPNGDLENGKTIVYINKDDFEQSLNSFVPINNVQILKKLEPTPPYVLIVLLLGIIFLIFKYLISGNLVKIIFGLRGWRTTEVNRIK